MPLSPFSSQGTVDKISYLVSLPEQAYRKEASPVGTLLPPTRAPPLEASTGSEGPLSLSRTLPHVRSLPPDIVEQEKPDIATRVGSSSTTSRRTNRNIFLPKADEL